MNPIRFTGIGWVKNIQKSANMATELTI